MLKGMSNDLEPSCEHPEFWESRYRENQMPWDLDEPAPPFVTLLKETLHDLPPGKMAVLGSGSGHDAALFAQHGFEVTGFDFATGAVARAQARYGKIATFVEADIFSLPPEYTHTFDYVLEHTCFCAIHPSKRFAYVEAVKRLLKPQGQFLALFWMHQEWGGPPFKTTETEVRSLFEPTFDIQWHISAPNSIERRAGEEWLYLMQKQP